MPELVNHQRTDEWLDARLGRITASRAAACLHLNPHQSSRAAWREILGTEKQQENPHMRWGIQFEATARLAYECCSGNMVTETGFWVHPLLGWLGASPDGLIGDDGLVEVKCPTLPPKGVPIYHRIQCLIQLACTERLWCDYYAWARDGETFCQRIYRSGIPGLIVRLQRFYEEFVIGKGGPVEPPRKKPKRRSKCKTATTAATPSSGE